MNLPGCGTWQLITEGAAFRDLKTDWERLFAANPKHRPFQAWSWTIAWLNHLAGPYELHVVCMRGEEGQLEFVLPMVRSTGNGRYRRPRLSTMCAYGPECSDHIGPLRLSLLDAQAAAFAAVGIAETCNVEDRIELGSLDNLDRFALKLDAELRRGGRTVRLEEFAACPAADLPETWDAYLQTLSSNFRSQVRRFRKRIDNAETLRFISLDSSEADTFARALIRLNRSRMGAKGKVSSLENSAFRDFLLEAIPSMARAGLAWMDVLEDRGKIVGAALNLAHGHSVFYYMGGFDDSSKNLRPGTALFARVIERSIELGYKRYDFLRGAESYKYRWSATDVHTYHATIYPHGMIRGPLSCGIDGLRIRGRNLIRWLRRFRKIE